jgi:lipoate---protein ligase
MTPMRLLDRSLATPEDNLALDEALLDAAQAVEASGERLTETLRFWESAQPAIVLGRSGRLADEVDVDACARAGVRVLRRVSGGGTVVLGPGCLAVTLVLSLTARPEHRDIRRSMAAIVSSLAAALPVEGLHLEGTSDLCWHEWKVSGHAQRRTRDALLHHGTILYDFDLPLIPALLREPARQPEYRGHRPHLEFVRNLPLSVEAIKHAITHVWSARADEHAVLPPFAHLVQQKYANPRWNEQGDPTPLIASD